MNIISLLVVVLLTGCASMDRVVCYGTGTCDRLYAVLPMPAGHSTTGPVNLSRPAGVGAYSVNLPSGGYLVVPNTTTGRAMSVIQTSRTK